MFNENNIICIQCCKNLLFVIKLSSEFLHGSNIYKLSENYTQFLCLFPLLLLEREPFLLIIREITIKKTSNFIIKLGMRKKSTDIKETFVIKLNYFHVETIYFIITL